MIDLELEPEEAAALYEALSRQWHNGVIHEFTTKLAERIKSEPKAERIEVATIATDLISHCLLELRRINEITRGAR